MQEWKVYVKSYEDENYKELLGVRNSQEKAEKFKDFVSNQLSPDCYVVIESD